MNENACAGHVCKHNCSREKGLRILSVRALIAKVELFRPLYFPPKGLAPLKACLLLSPNRKSVIGELLCIFLHILFCHLRSTLVPRVISSLLSLWGSAGVWKEGVPKVTPRDFPLSKAAESDNRAIHYSTHIPMNQHFTRRCISQRFCVSSAHSVTQTDPWLSLRLKRGIRALDPWCFSSFSPFPSMFNDSWEFASTQPLYRES